MKKLLIRLDDITPDMNWENFEVIRSIFDKHHILPIIGVVPDNRDPNLSVSDVRKDFWEVMRALQEHGWTIAQHGYCHIYETKKSGMLGINPFSEFAGLPYEKQYKKLAKGQEILHKQGICAKMFMAPGHTYDRKTLKALHALGFTMVTDGYSKEPYHANGLVFLPCTLAKPKEPKCVDTLCLHINSMTKQELEELEQFISGHAGLICSVNDLIGVTEQGEELTERASETSKICVKKKNPLIWLEERKNLRVRKIKAFVAENEIMQQYFERTDHADAAVKKKKRLLGLPGLVVRTVFRIKYK